MLWDNIKENHVFKDGSIVTQRHQTHNMECYTLDYGKLFTASKDHLLKVNITRLPSEAQDFIQDNCKANIPLRERMEIGFITYVTKTERELIIDYISGKINNLECFKHIEDTFEYYYFKLPKIVEVLVKRIPIEYDNQKIDDENYWIPIEGLAFLFNQYGPLQINENITIKNITHAGWQPCFCVSTNTGYYETNGLISHNSVLLTSIIIHCLEHRDKIAVAAVDLKQTEFSDYKNTNGVVGVATSVKEACEVLRIASASMYQRNKEMAKLGIKSLRQHKPSKKSGLVYMSGREYNESDSIRVRIDSQENTMTASEIVEYLKENKLIEVCLNDKDWIPVNKHCVDYIFEDEMKMLVVIVDEYAELTMKGGGPKTAENKLIDEYKDEITAHVTSITQLGRSSGIHAIIATQKPSAMVLPTVLRSNPLALDTRVEVKSNDKVLSKKISDINTNDYIKGIDNEWYPILGKTDIFKPRRMFRILFSNGLVDCSGDHLWTIFINSIPVTLSTEIIHSDPSIWNNPIGRLEDNIRIMNIVEIQPRETMCIETAAPENQFQIYTKDV